MSREMSRREFLLMTAAVGVSAKLAPWAPLRPIFAVSKPAVPNGRFAYSPRVRKFVVGLPGLGPDGANEIGQYIPLATKSTRHFRGRMTDVYDLAVAESRQTMHPDLPGPTRFWGYRDVAAAHGMYLGGVIVAHRDRPVLLNVTNRLPNKQLIPSDPTIMAGGGKMVAICRTTVVSRTCMAASPRGSATARRFSGSPRRVWRGRASQTCREPRCRPVRRTTTTRCSKARGSSGTTTTRSGSRARTCTRASPRHSS